MNRTQLIVLLLAVSIAVALRTRADRTTERPAVPADTLPPVLPTDVPLGLEEFSAVQRDPSLEQLGRRLFFAPELSRDRSLACASCHRPELGFADDSALSVGVDGQLTLRNSPSLWNKALEPSFSWDGHERTLEEQVLAPIQMPNEMDLAIEDAVARLDSDPAWVAAFEQATGSRPSSEALAGALAAFVRALMFADTPVDRFRAGDVAALTPEEQSGLWLFEAKAGCWRCHAGPNFSDGEFHNTGVGVVGGEPQDGLFSVTGDESDRGHFKTAGLRALTRTAPYMHDGSLEALEDVVEFYAGGGNPNAHLSPELAVLELTEREKSNLVALLRALSRPATD